MSETRIRSITKATTWRLFGSCVTAGMVFYFTREWRVSVSIGMLEIVGKLLLYYIHERAWDMVGWGKTTLHRMVDKI